FSIGALVLSSAYGADLTLFKDRAEISGTFEAGKPAKVPLGAEILRNSREGLVDLRIVDAYVKELPSVLFSQVRQRDTEASVVYDVVRYHESKGGEAELELSLSKPPSAPVRQLVISTPNRDFYKKVSVSSLNAGGDAKTLAADAIFDFSSKVDLRKT